MKTLNLFCVVFMLAVTSFAQTISNIEYDGVYIEVASNQYAKLAETLNFKAKWRVDYQSNWPTIYLTDEEKRTDVKQIKKIIFSGFSTNDMKLLSIHPANSVGKLYTVLSGGGRPASTYYTYKCKDEITMREPISCRFEIAKIKDGYYEVTLPDGIKAETTYLIWIGDKFWFFKSASDAPKKVLTDVKTPSITGAYIKSKNQMYRPLEKSTYRVGTYAEYRTSCKCYVNRESKQLGFSSYYNNKDFFYDWEVMSSHKKSLRVFDKMNFDGIAVKGDYYDFNNAIINKLAEVNMGGVDKVTILTDQGKIEEGKVFMMSKDNQVGFQKKTNGDLCIFVPVKPLEIGDYSICVGADCWLFSIK
jgi:hypothetical protein